MSRRRIVRPVAHSTPAVVADPLLRADTPLQLLEPDHKSPINGSARGGLSANKLATLPGVHSFSAMTRYVHGGRKRVIELIQMAALNNEPVACAFWAIYVDLPGYQQQRGSLDDVCAAANVRPRDLMLTIVATAFDFGNDVSNLIAATTQPGVVHQLAKSAMRIGGQHAEIAHKDRIAFLQGRGFLPVPKSAVVNVHASATAQAAAAASAEPSVPKFAADVAGSDTAKRDVQATIVDAEVIPSFLGDKAG